mgnify:CR=1 FL=1
MISVNRMTLLFLAAAVATVCGRAGAQPLPAEVIRYADVVLHNGKIITVDANFSMAQAIAVRDGKILKVGRDAEVLALAGPATRRIDLQGRSVVPGLIDTHSHLHEYGLDRHAPTMNPNLLEIKIEGRSEEEMLQRLADEAKKKKPGEWLITRILPRAVADGFVINKPALISTKSRQTTRQWFTLPTPRPWPIAPRWSSCSSVTIRLCSNCRKISKVNIQAGLVPA